MSVHRQRAEAAAELKRWDTVIAEAKLAIGDEPKQGGGYALLAQGLHAKGEGKAAIEAANAGLAVAPSSEWLHRLRAAILNDQGVHEPALAAVREAIRLSPHNASGHGLAAKIYNNQKKHLDARDAIHRALELDADTAWLHRTAGDIELPVNATNAEAHYRDAVRIDPRDAVAVNNLGVALERLGRAEEAALAYRSAVLLDPTLAVAKRNTHASVKKLAVPGRVALGGIGAGALGFKFLFAGQMCAHTVSGVGRSSDSGYTSDDTIPIIVIAVITIVLIFIAVKLSVRRADRVKQERHVRETYPELWAMYQQLENDRKRGRL